MTRLLLNKTPGDRVVVRATPPSDLARGVDDEPVAVPPRSDLADAPPLRRVV